MSRDIAKASDHLMRADDEELKTIAHHDPDMIRDVAAALSAPRAPDTSPSVDGETKLVYIKRWRTIVRLPAAYADEIREALSAPRVEPVAWQSSINGKDWYIVDDASDENLYALDQNGWKTRPLYAHPAPPDTVREALKAIIVASNDFRDGMPKVWRDGHGWEGDPLQDAIDEAAKLLLPAPPDAGDRG